MNVNEDKVIEVLARIENEREDFEKGVRTAVGFDMGEWFGSSFQEWVDGKALCRTTACLAGHAVLMEGYEMHDETHCVRPDDGEIFGVAELGGKILGVPCGDPYGDDPAYEGPFYLNTLDEVYTYFAIRMNVDEVVLRDKVEAQRGLRPLT